MNPYRDALPPGEVLEFATTPLDRTGVPAWSVLHATPSGFTGGLGYGTDDESAQLSAWGELTEAVLLAEAIRTLPVRHSSFAELLRESGPRGVVDPLTLCLEAGTDYSADRPVDWVALRRWTTGEQVWVPWDFVSSSGAHGPFVTPITNGQGAGDTVERALAHALGELLQRDGNGRRFRALDEGVVLDLGPDDCHVSDPGAREALRLLRSAGIEVLPKLAAVELGVVNAYVVGVDEQPAHPLMVTAAGEAAHPDRDTALRKALLEFAAARSRKTFMHGPLEGVARIAPTGYLDRFVSDPATQEPRALREMMRWLQMDAAELRALMEPKVLSHRESVGFDTLPSAPDAGDPKVLCDRLVESLTAAGLDVLALVTESRSAVVVKAVVPGLEVETMSYGRIGERGVSDLLARGDGATGLHGIVGLGTPPAGAEPVLLTDEAVERLGGRPWLDRAAIDRVVGPLYPLYREPARHAAPAALEKGLLP